jgi:hypothetical protein
MGNKAQQLAEERYPDEYVEVFLGNAVTIKRDVERAAFIAGYEADKWISVEDELPNATDADSSNCVLGWDRLYNRSHKCDWKDISEMPLRFSHWQPLPSPPKTK